MKWYEYRGWSYCYRSHRKSRGWSVEGYGRDNIILVPWYYGEGARRRATIHLKNIIDKIELENETSLQTTG